MSLLSLVAKTIPPEASSPSEFTRIKFEEDGGLCRFVEHDHGELDWAPDPAPPRPHAAVDSIQLESRGITQETAEAPRQKPVRRDQAEIWKKQSVHRFTVAAKLREAGRADDALALEDCHSYYTVAVCTNCGIIKRYPNRCDRLYCPECQPHLAQERKRQVEWWTKQIAQPKHVVLTVRNQPTLTPRHIDELRRWFTNLRKRNRYANWKGGFYSLEVTNEGRGWHLHIHCLVDVKWIDSAQLALDWDNVTNHNGRIIKVKDCRQEDYLAEVTKYAVKGSQLATWKPKEIAEFVTAFAGKRTFGVFGNLYAARTEFAEWIAILKSGHNVCDCGCTEHRYYTELEWEIAQLQPDQPANAPPVSAETQPALALPPETNWPE